MLRPTSPSRWPRAQALAAVVAVMLYALPVFAQSPPEGAGESAEQTEAAAEGEPSATAATTRVQGAQGHAFWWLYVSGLGLAALIPLGYYFYRRFRPEHRYDMEGAAASLEGEALARPASDEGVGRRRGLSRAEKAFFSVPESTSGSPSAQMAIGQSGGADRMCPECGEQFPASVVLCPYDSTPLENIDEPRGADSGGETVLERQRCPGCGRRYEPGPEYCYHDGMHLRQDTVEDAEEAPEFKACETCGWEGDSEDRMCPKDGAELTSVVPDEEGRATPPLPVMVCSECGGFAEPGRARCPDDDTVLTPLRNAHARQFPAHGFGPHRKICQECGETFSQAARYCTFDGSELVPMN